MPDYSYLGSGKIYLRVAGAAAPLAEIGNVSKLEFAVSEDAKELKDYTQPGGGTMNEVRRISAVEVSMTLHDLSPENLSRALYGSSDAIAAGTVTAEQVVGYEGGLTRLAKPASAITTVTDSTGATTYTPGTDYELRAGGLYVLAGTTITDGETLKVTYTAVAADLVQALTSAAQEYELAFAGLNEARSGKAADVDAYRVKLGALGALSLIGEDFAGLEVKGKLLKDASKTGTGVSQYFTVRMAQ